MVDLVPFESSIAQRGLLPEARLGRRSTRAGGILVRLWDWLRLPRVERFRRCARCGLIMVADRERARRGIERSGALYCDGWMGEPYNRCWMASFRYG